MENRNKQTGLQSLSEIKVKGERVSDLPDDLYIPPEALEVFLDAFEGPLDLLLYLIKKQNIDILDIPIAQITEQYMAYVEIMKGANLDLAAEYLVMAAMLAEIKSRMLLPKNPHLDDEEGDPRAELIRRLQEYERYKAVAEDINALPRRERDTFPASAITTNIDVVKPLAHVELDDLLKALNDVLKRVSLNATHHVQKEGLSIRERMSIILDTLDSSEFVLFNSLFTAEEGRQGVVVTFIAMLELLKGGMIDIVQSEPFAPIHLRSRLVE